MVVSSTSPDGVGGVTSDMEVEAMCAGREDNDVVAWCFGGFREVVGPL